MLSGLYLNTAGALVEEIRQEVIANNLANVETNAFRPDVAVFRKRLNEALEDVGPRDSGQPALLEPLGGGVFLDEVVYSRRTGALHTSDNPLDIALEGDGFLVVERDGQRFYTRDGRLRRDPDGWLVTLDGRSRVLDTRGQAIRVPVGELSVSGRGELTVGEESLGRLALAGSLDPDRFEKVGGGLYRWIGDGEPAAATPTVMQSFLERSGAQPIREMVRLIESHRAYEANMQMIRIQDGTLQRAVNDFARLA